MCAPIPLLSSTFTSTNPNPQLTANGAVQDAQLPYDPFSMSSMAQGMPSAPYNPYLEENSAMPSNGAAYYQPQTGTFTAPAQPVSTAEYQIVSNADTASFNTTCMLPSDPTERI